MFEDEDDRRPMRRLTILPLDALGVAELQSYIGELRGEIARAEAAIAARRSHRGAADLLFRQPTNNEDTP